MNRLDAMTLFVRVADLGSFAAAANHMGVARSVVTRQIAALEEHLGVKLIVRTTRKLTLTSAGADYLDKCRTILDLVESAEADVMEARLTPRGNLRIALPLSFGLKRIAPVLPRFLQSHPEITLALDFNDRQQNLIDEGIDMSIRISARLDPGIVARKLGETRLITVASPGYLRQHGHPRHPDELVAHQALGYTAKASNRPLEFWVEGKPYSVYVPFRMQANNGDALVEAARQGMGITVQPDFIVAESIERDTLVPLLEDYALPPLGIYAVLPSSRYMPQRLRVWIEFLAAELGQGSGKRLE
ncbi:MAG: LysR family transcriptional regulator [Comamonadaceae bacterium]|nr:LysR family transcriptional regulator [Comamonadaceae bacterium]